MFKIYFGRYPSKEQLQKDKLHLIEIDKFFMEYMNDSECDFNFDTAVEELVKSFRPGFAYHTLNPLIINFFTDDFAKNHVYIIRSDGEEIFMGTDESLLKKLQWMGPGDAVCDDTRSFKS